MAKQFAVLHDHLEVITTLIDGALASSMDPLIEQLSNGCT